VNINLECSKERLWRREFRSFFKPNFRLAPLALIVTDVYRDAIQPGHQISLLTELVQRTAQSQKYFLSRILGVGVVQK
jgi:hypothetical protein